MPQSALAANVATNPSGATVPLKSGADGGLIVDTGGQSVALNQTTQVLLKAGKGRAKGVIIIAPGSTSGAFSLNDAATVGGIAAANLLWTLPFGAATNVAGASFQFDIPFTNGLVLSLPGSGSPICNVLYS